MWELALENVWYKLRPYIGQLSSSGFSACVMPGISAARNNLTIQVRMAVSLS